jgi:hypothetical protein
MKSDSKADRLIVYTVLMGQVAELNPVPDSSNVEFVCLTDQIVNQTNGWTIRVVDPKVSGDSPRSSRHPKVNPHLYFEAYARSIYVDTSVKLEEDPEFLWSRLVPKTEIVFGAINHSFHFTLLEEIKAVSELGFDDDSVILQHLELAEEIFPGYLNSRPIWGGILARRHNDPDLKLAMDSWYSQILNFSRRDQLSLPVALRSLRGNQTHLSYLDNHMSDFHVWPSGGYQKPASFFTANKASANWSTKELSERDSLLTERDSLLTERDSLLTERDSLLESNSWRLTKPLRVLSQILSNRRLKG